MRLLGTAALAALAFATATIADAAPYVLKSEQSGRYVAAAGGILAATERSAKTAVTFDVVRLGGGRVAFRLSDGRFVRAGIGEGTFVGIGGNRAAGWETFRLVPLGGGRTAIRSAHNGLHVRAGVGQGSRLAAVSPHVRGWETFRLVDIGAAPAPQAPVAGRVEGSYRVVAVAGAPVPPGVRREATITFGRDGRLSGRGVCNRFSASYEAAHGRLSVGPITTTKMLCRENADWERAILMRLGAASGVRAGRNGIVLTDGGRPSLTLARR